MLPAPALLLALSTLPACGLFDRDPPAPAPAPAPTPPPPAAPAPATTAALTVEWPLWSTARVPEGASVPLPAGSALLDLDLDPQGRRALLLIEGKDGPRVWTWDFANDPTPLLVEGRTVRELESSPLRDEVFAISQVGEAWAVERLATVGGSLAPVGEVLRSDAPLSDLVAPAMIYEPWGSGAAGDRVFVAREGADGHRQVLSAMSSGARAYEVTAPTGALGALSDPALRSPGEYEHGPRVLAVPWARPLGVDPFTGELLWADRAGAVHGLSWNRFGGDDPSTFDNWGEDRGRPTDETWTVSTNGSFRLGWQAGRAGVHLRDRDGRELQALATTLTFSAPPRLSMDGRTLVGPVQEEGRTVIRTVAAGHLALAMRYLDQSQVDQEERDTLLARGIQVQATEREQLYHLYEEFAYAAPEDGGPPVFASIDGMLEVLHAGFEAVFLRVELEASRPALERVFAALSAAGRRDGLARVREIGDVGARILAGDYEHAEGQRILAEQDALSELHGVQVAYADFHPRGPYAARQALSHYFRAFKFLNLLKLTDEEQVALSKDEELTAALTAWRATQAAMVSPSRRPALFQEAFSPPAWVQPECIPWRARQAPPRPLALSWGVDAEILQGTVQQLTEGEAEGLSMGRPWADIDADPAIEHTPRHCGVRGRLRPSGLDLLIGLGASHARAWMAAEYGAHPDLAAAHDRLSARFSGPVDGSTLAGSWLRLVQVLASDTAVPEGVDGDLWRARLAETALASWTGFRHTTVLLQETTAAEAGAGGEGFERLVVEPGRGVVDPVPQAWAALAGTLQGLARHGGSVGTDDRLVEVLTEAATQAAALGSMAERQGRGEPLYREEYEQILGYARTVEHPFLLLKSALPEDGALAGPAPMAKIVDIHTWTDEGGQTQVWHAAMGNPQEILVLGGDRGFLVPARGGVYSWYEQVAPTPLDDTAWRAAVASAPRPDWVVAARQ